MSRFCGKMVPVPRGSCRRIADTACCQDDGIRRSLCSFLGFDTGDASGFSDQKALHTLIQQDPCASLLSNPNQCPGYIAGLLR